VLGRLFLWGVAGYNTTWQTAFKGAGTAGTGTVNSYINLVVVADTAG
jgi:hypothetical protein